jgi:hypothetical protein
MGASLKLAEAAVGAARLVGRGLPKGVKKQIEDRIFYFIFQKTRVENDAYGWRPPPPGGTPPGGTRPEDEPG